MSDAIVASTKHLASQTAAQVAWAQWGQFGFFQVADSPRTLIDPEALLVLSLATARDEPSLSQALAWWAATGASLISLPRLDHVLRGTPIDLTKAVSRFAAQVWGAGGASGSWKRRAKEQHKDPISPPERLKGGAAPRVLPPSNAMLRMRMMTGVGVKADLLAFLAARGPTPSTITQMERGLGYARASLLYGSQDIARAGGATLIPPTPLRYISRPGVIDLGAVPPWRFWPQIAAFLIGASRWGEALKNPTPFLLGASARDLHNLLRSFWNEHPLPAAYPIADPREHPGEAFVEPFAASVESVVAWLADGLPE